MSQATDSVLWVVGQITPQLFQIQPGFQEAGDSGRIHGVYASSPVLLFSGRCVIANITSTATVALSCVFFFFLRGEVRSVGQVFFKRVRHKFSLGSSGTCGSLLNESVGNSPGVTPLSLFQVSPLLHIPSALGFS